MRKFKPNEIAALAAKTAFGQPLVTNVVRGLLVETIVSTALCPYWTWCSADYAPYDFAYDEPSSGQRVRLEVKQSSACQSWPHPKPSSIRWDIRPRQGFYDGSLWVPRPGRNADIYVLAAHPEPIREAADHRDPAQWRFFVVDALRLPEIGKSIGRAAVEAMAFGVDIEGLGETVERVRLALPVGSVIRHNETTPRSLQATVGRPNAAS